ncbi:unnamed protein product [Amoebophrya sp. A25]|nr:unnamed protein product [Amoebophrya sp. A25]|eukprot:GSA25T00016538001.1
MLFARLALSSLVVAPLTVSAGTNEVGKKFMEENAKKLGVVTLPSGLQYKVLREGKGRLAPKKDTPCECHYAGTTPTLTPDAIDKDEKDWDEFDSSYKRGEPTTFAPSQVIAGWTEAMQLMKEGDKWEMYIPSELGYGDNGSGAKIKGGDVLIFRMEILKINGPTKRLVTCDYPTGKNCDADEKMTWKTYSDTPIEVLQTEIDIMSGKTKQTMKKGMREPIMREVKLLKGVMKAKKKLAKAQKAAASKDADL